MKKNYFKVKNLAVFLLLFSALTMFTGTYAFSMGRGDSNFMKHKFMRNRKCSFNVFMLKRKLRLTKKQVRQIIIAKKEKFKALTANKGNLRNPMLNALKSGTFNKSVFVSDLTNNVKSKAEIKADFISKFFNILTPAQRNRFINLIKNRIKNRIKHLEFMKKMLNEKIDMMKKMQGNLAK